MPDAEMKTKKVDRKAVGKKHSLCGVSCIFGDVTATIRPDFVEAHERTWESLAAAGTWWSSRQRRELASFHISFHIQAVIALTPWH